jgi:ATP-binding cassette subfamily B protein
MLFGKYLNKYYKKYWYMFIIGVLSLIAVDYVQLFEPIFLGQIVDHLSQNESADVSFIGSLCIRLLGVALVMFLGRMLWRFTLFGASRKTEAGMRREMFQKCERLSQNYFHSTKVGSIMSWFTTDLETIEEYTGFGTVQIVDATFLGILVVIRMLSLDWLMTIFALIPMILIVVLGALVEKFMAIKWEQRQKNYDRLYDFAQENFTGIAVIKAFVKETKEVLAFSKVAKKNKDANIDYVRVSIVFDTLIEITIALILSMILGLGSWFVWACINASPVHIFGHAVNLTPGNLITFIGYFDTLVWPMIALGSLFSMRARARASLKRVSDFLDAPEDVKDAQGVSELTDVQGEIEFRNLTFAYPSAPDRKVLSDVSAVIRPGELIGVIGRVGSGKTTLITLLSRLYNVDEGTIFIDGKDIMKCSIKSVRNAVAFVPQDNFLFSDTVANNIGFASSDYSRDDIIKGARFADVDDNIKGFSSGYDTVSGERGITLSGGQKQRISLARAFLKNSPVLVLDDSVSAVDVDTEETILKNIRCERNGKTTIIIASRISSVSHADRILVLCEGKVEAFDTPDRLLEISPTYKKMVYLQELEKEVKGGN